MAKQKTPHTQSQQNTNFAQTDLNPDDMAQTVIHSDDGREYENADGAQTGTGRSPRDMPGSANPRKTEPHAAANEGSVTSRTAHDASRQGISNRSAESDLAGQEKVVSQREDAQAGVNHNGKTH